MRTVKKLVWLGTNSSVVRNGLKGKVGRPDSEDQGINTGINQREVGRHGRV